MKMDVKTLEKRIESAKNEIQKIEKSIERKKKEKQKNDNEINKRYESGDFDKEKRDSILSYKEKDFNREVLYLNKKIKEVEDKIQKYNSQLEEEKTKESNRNIQVILDFLENWKRDAFNFYVESLDRYRQDYKKLKEKIAELKINGWNLRVNREIVKLQDEFKQIWRFLIPYLEIGKNSLDENRLKRELDKETKVKYDSLVFKIQETVGTIIDVSGLYIANNGQINGIIKGKKGNARVETIEAGGYNIQRFHYRTLVIPIK